MKFEDTDFEAPTKMKLIVVLSIPGVDHLPFEVHSSAEVESY